jgi:hypothetical protein
MRAARTRLWRRPSRSRRSCARLRRSAGNGASGVGPVGIARSRRRSVLDHIRPARAGLPATGGGDRGGGGWVAAKALTGPGLCGGPVEVGTHAGHGVADSAARGRARRGGKQREPAHSAEADLRSRPSCGRCYDAPGRRAASTPKPTDSRRYCAPSTCTNPPLVEGALGRQALALRQLDTACTNADELAAAVIEQWPGAAVAGPPMGQRCQDRRVVSIQSSMRCHHW